jgi:regulator of sigma E protease
MGEAFTNLLAFVVAISILVAVHEFGHYLVGRLAGMKVLRFSIGFGKPIWSWIRGRDRTEYCISAVPLGGYVRFLDSREGPVAPEDRGRAFNHRPVPARIAVLLAGPGFNFLFAILAYWALSMHGLPAVRPAVGEVTPQSYSERAGLETGDRIVAVDGQDTDNWDQALQAMFDALVDDGSIPMTLEDLHGHRRSTVIEVGADAARLTEPGLLFDGLGFQPGRAPAIVDVPESDSAAAAAGIRRGDRIVAVAGDPILGFGDLVDAVLKRPGERVTIEYVRDGRLDSVATVLGSRQVEGKESGFLGVRTMLDKLGPVASVAAAVGRTWDSTLFTFRMLGRMATGDVSIKNISGPINIAQYAGESAEQGPMQFLIFLALVSISLGVLNLLPVPVLDGGQILYQGIELVKGSPMSERSQAIGQQFGILALIVLMSFAFYNDIARILG